MSPDDDSPLPEGLAELVESCRGYVHKALGFELDFTPETLPVLDHYAMLIGGTAAQRPELLALLVRALGAYFGEVVRLRFGGFWRLPSPNVHDWQLCARPVFLWINPVGIAYDAIYQGQEHEGPRSHLRVQPEAQEMVRNRLAGLPPIEERDYYRFSTRFEAIEIAVQALRLFAEEDGSGLVELSEEDYAPGGLLH